MRRRGAGSREREGQPQGERPGCSATTSTLPLLSSQSSSPCLSSSFLPAAARFTPPALFIAPCCFIYLVVRWQLSDRYPRYVFLLCSRALALSLDQGPLHSLGP